MRPSSILRHRKSCASRRPPRLSTTLLLAVFSALGPAALVAQTASTKAAEAAQAREPERGEPSGPLAIGDLFPLRRGFLTELPASARVLPAGEWQLDLMWSASNTLARSTAVEVALEARDQRQPVDPAFLRGLDGGDGVLYLDAEEHATQLALHRGLGGGWQVGVAFSLRHAGEGGLDGLVEGFHDLAGLDQDGRAGSPKDDYLLYFSSPREERIFSQPPGTGLGDVILTVRREAGRPFGGWRLALDGALKLPLGDQERLMSSGSLDFGARVLAERFLGIRCYFHAGLGFVHYGAWPAVGTRGQTRLTGFFGFERVNGNGSSTVIQLVGIESPLAVLGVPELDHESYQGSLGGRIPIRPGTYFLVAITENLLHFDSGSDLAFHIGLTTRLR